MQTDDEFVTISPLHVNGSRHCTKVGQCQDVIPFNCNTVKVLPAEIFGKLLEGIIESVDEFYSENLAQEVVRGMRESASRGFWVSSYAPFGYNRVMVQDGAKKRPSLQPNPDASHIVKRIFDMAEAGNGMTDITRTLNDEGIASPRGKLWGKTSVHAILINEAYTGTLVWGASGT